MADLTAFLRRAAAEPFVFGQWDCAMTLANWVREQSGADPAATLRGTYSSEAGWQEIVAGEGSLLALVERLALGARMHEVNEPQAGDIGVILAPIGGEAGGIFGGSRWVLKSARGLVAARRTAIAAWGLR